MLPFEPSTNISAMQFDALKKFLNELPDLVEEIEETRIPTPQIDITP